MKKSFSDQKQNITGNILSLMMKEYRERT